MRMKAACEYDRYKSVRSLLKSAKDVFGCDLHSSLHRAGNSVVQPLYFQYCQYCQHSHQAPVFQNFQLNLE